MATSRANPLPARRADFSAALLAWFRQHARPLPWRNEPSPYKTVVSEFMLQQTQVRTVLPFFARWIDALPSFAALAAAPESQVLKLWEGLGYYSRARNLHRLAKAVASLPHLPETADAWRELPGVGPYTAAAISSIAFGVSAACVDGNVVRILARLTANNTEFRDSGSAAKAFAELAQALLPPSTAGEHNEAMMELGATVCLRARPLCPACPVREFCVAARLGKPETYPRLAAKIREQKSVTRIWCERAGALLLHRAPDGARRFASLYELPTAEQLGVDARELARGEPLARKRRGITRFQITETFYLLPAPKAPLGADLEWVPLAGLGAITMSGPHRRWTTELLAKRASAT